MTKQRFKSNASLVSKPERTHEQCQKHERALPYKHGYGHWQEQEHYHRCKNMSKSRSKKTSTRRHNPRHKYRQKQRSLKYMCSAGREKNCAQCLEEEASIKEKIYNMALESLSMTFMADGKRKRLPLIFYSFLVIFK